MKVSLLRRRIAAVLFTSATVMFVSSCAVLQAPSDSVPPAASVDVAAPVAITVVVPEVVAPAAAEVVVEAAVVEASPPVIAVDAPLSAVPVAKVVKQVIPPNTFLVTAELKDTSHLFYGRGSKFGMVINGVQGKELVLERGQSYTFKVDTGVQHDFYLSRSAKGWGAGTLTGGVKGNFTYKGVVTFTPGGKTPAVVYYQCRNHKNMGSKIHVVNKGEASKVVFGVRDGAQSGVTTTKKKSAFTSGNPAKQKIMFAEMFIAMSPAAKRIDASDHADAKQMLTAARSRLNDAKVALNDGDDTKAIAIVDEALRSMTAAAQLVPSKKQLGELQAHFDELLKGAHSYEKSYHRNLKMMKKKGKKNLPNLNMEQIRKMIADAEKLAGNNEFVEANKQLSIVQRSITGALTQLLADETMDYTLNFDDPQEEYEYELSRYKSYEELLPIAIEQKHPAKQMLALMRRFVDKGKDIYALSGPKAKEGDYKTAIQMLQGATAQLQRALKIIGVR